MFEKISEGTCLERVTKCRSSKDDDCSAFGEFPAQHIFSCWLYNMAAVMISDSYVGQSTCQAQTSSRTWLAIDRAAISGRIQFSAVLIRWLTHHGSGDRSVVAHLRE